VSEGVWDSLTSGLEVSRFENPLTPEFHMEMIVWHATHWALWDRFDRVQDMLLTYDDFLDSSIVRAQTQQVSALPSSLTIGIRQRRAMAQDD
jgi:hypothetical protein